MSESSLKEKSFVSKIVHWGKKGLFFILTHFSLPLNYLFPSLWQLFLLFYPKTNIKCLIVIHPGVPVCNCISRKRKDFFFQQEPFQFLLSKLSFQWYVAFLTFLECPTPIASTWQRELLLLPLHLFKCLWSWCETGSLSINHSGICSDFQSSSVPGTCEKVSVMQVSQINELYSSLTPVFTKMCWTPGKAVKPHSTLDIKFNLLLRK